MALSPRDIQLHEGGVRAQVVGMTTPSNAPAFTTGSHLCAARDLAPSEDNRGFGAMETSSNEGSEQEPLQGEEHRWALILLVVCGLDLIASAVIAIVSFRYAYFDDGVSLYCMGFQAISHLTSSAALVLRFMGEFLPQREVEFGDQVSEACLLRERRRRDLKREQGMSIFMGISMLLGSAALLFKAFRKIRFWDKWYLDHADLDREIENITGLLAWWGFAMYGLEAALRFVVARKLRRSIIWHAFVVSVVALLFLLVLGIAASYEKEWSWKAEPIAAIVLVFIQLFEGVRMIYLHLDDVDDRLKNDTRA